MPVQILPMYTGLPLTWAYARFKKDGRRGAPEEKLKSVLADVLQDLRLQKKCYVRYEFKQGCFHITAR